MSDFENPDWKKIGSSLCRVLDFREEISLFPFKINRALILYHNLEYLDFKALPEVTIIGSTVPNHMVPFH